MTEEQAKRNLRFASYLENEVKDEQFDMWEWCGTAACVAGHALTWPEYRSACNPSYIRTDYNGSGQYLDTLGVADVMGISKPEADDLCYARDVCGEDVSRQNRVDFIRALVAKYHPSLVESKP